jgi:hypothetical protein
MAQYKVLDQTDRGAEAGKQNIGPFCRERGLGEASFYYWRKRLRKGPPPLRFEVVETTPSVASNPATALCN